MTSIFHNKKYTFQKEVNGSRPLHESLQWSICSEKKSEQMFSCEHNFISYSGLTRSTLPQQNTSKWIHLTSCALVKTVHMEHNNILSLMSRYHLQ